MDKWVDTVCRRHAHRLLMPGCRFSDLMRGQPHKRGQRVIVSGYNGAAMLRQIISIWRDGGVPCMIPPTMPNEIRRYCKDLIDGHPVDEREAIIMFTSSTSGTHPKGVRLSHENLISHIRMLREHIPKTLFGSDDRTFAFLPWTHCYGLMGECLSVMDRGAFMGVMGHPWSVPGFLWGMHRTRPTILFVVPKLLSMLSKYPRWAWGGDRLRCIVSGGAYMDPGLKNAFPGVPILQGYGMTEMSPMVALQNSMEDAKKNDVGCLLPGVSVHIDNDYQILVNGPNRFLGYLGEPDIPPDKPHITGDCGLIGEGGRLILMGRNAEMIKMPNGRFVSLSDIEDDISRSSSWIREICLWQTPFGLYGVVSSPRAVNKVASPRFGLTVCVRSTTESFLTDRDFITVKGEKARGRIRDRFCVLSK